MISDATQVEISKRSGFLMTNLHDKMVEDMQLKGFAHSAQRTYLKNLRHFENFFQKPAKQLEQEELDRYTLDFYMARL